MALDQVKPVYGYWVTFTVVCLATDPPLLVAVKVQVVVLDGYTLNEDFPVTINGVPWKVMICESAPVSAQDRIDD